MLNSGSSRKTGGLFKLLSPHTGGQAVYSIHSREQSASHIMSNERIRKAQSPPSVPPSHEVFILSDDSIPLRVEVKRPSRAIEDDPPVSYQEMN